MADEIKIKAKLDTSEFDRSVKDLENKLKQMSKTGQQLGASRERLGGGGLMGRYAQEAFGDFDRESQQKLREMFQTQQRQAMNERITLRGKQTELGKLNKIEGEMTKSQKQRVSLLEKEISLLKERNRETIKSAANIRGMIKDDLPPSPPKPPPTRGGNINFMGLLKSLAIGGALRGGLNAATTGYEEFFVTRPRTVEQAKGTALQGASRELREAAAGRGSEQFVRAPERAKALEMAAKERQGRSNLDLVRGATGTAVGGLAGMATGAAAGALLGSAVMPVIGTAIGGITGGIAGAFGGGFLGAGERGRARLFDQERYNKMSIAEMMQNREAIEASLIAQDPTKAIARDFFSKNLDRNVRFQRQTGIRSDEEMFGQSGFLRTQKGVGNQFGGRQLRMEEIMRQSGSIMAAGGGTSTAQLSGFAGALNRQFGINNAAQTIGMLSGAGGLGVKGTEEAQKRLMIEAVRLGVDTSKMPQEMQRMTAMTAQIATAGGGFSESALRTVGLGVTGLSKGEIEAAGGAFQEFQNIAKQSTGFEGQQGFAFMLGKKGEQAFGKKAIDKIRGDHKLMSTLNQFSAEDLQKDPALLKGLARQIGIGEDELVKGMQQIGAFKQTRTEEESRAFDELKKITEGKTAEQISQLKTGDTEEARRYQDLIARTTIERTSTRGEQFSKKGAFARSATLNMIAGRQGGFAEGIGGIDEASLKFQEQLGKKITGAGEAELEARARGDIVKLDALNQHIKSFEKAAEMASGEQVKFSKVFEAVNRALEKNGNKMTDEIEKLTEQLSKMSEQMSHNGYVSTKAIGTK